MTLPLRFHRRVQGEIKKAYRWYEQQRSGLGDDFLGAIEEVFDRLRQTPEAHQVIYRTSEEPCRAGFLMQCITESA
jgi:hypothetical protein